MRDRGHLRLFADVEVDVGPRDVRGDDLRALGLEQLRDGRADAGPRARDERTLAGEARHGHAILPPWRSPYLRTRSSRRDHVGTRREGACCGWTSKAANCTFSREGRTVRFASTRPWARRRPRPAARRSSRWPTALRWWILPTSPCAPSFGCRTDLLCARTTARATQPGAFGSGRWGSTSRPARARSTATTAGSSECSTG